MRVLMSVTTWDAARVEAGLRECGLLTTTARDGVEVFESLDMLFSPVVILETDLPDMRWRVALQQLRLECPDAAILVLNNKGTLEDKVAALEIGADDIIDPRMRTEEIVSRILSVTGRRAGFAGPILRSGALKLDLRAKRAFWGPDQIEMSPSQYEIFELLCMNQSGIVTKDDIMGQLYGLEEGPDPRVIDVFICKIRTSLAMSGAPADMVETVRGRGFRMTIAEQAGAVQPLPFVEPEIPFTLPEAA